MKANDKTMYETFYKQCFWLEGWFKTEHKGTVSFVDQEHYTIFDELSAQWKAHNTIPLLNSLQARFGTKVVEVIHMVAAENIRREWAEIARHEPSQTIADLIRLLWKPMGRQGFEFTMERQEDGVQMHCTRCPHADLAAKLDGQTWFYYLICQGDPYIVEGFNPHMGFRRTKTLMEGHAYCDHFYCMK